MWWSNDAKSFAEIVKKGKFREMGVVKKSILKGTLICIMAVRVAEISNRGTKLERFLPKNQHTQRKLLNFESQEVG